jgi:hypothetical protein
VQQFSAVGRPVLIPVRATDSGRRPTRFAATDLPAGLRLDATTGLVYGVPTKPSTHSTTITATDSTGARGNTVISWVVSTKANSIVNGDFESGTGGWTQSTDVIREDGQYSNHGLGYAWLGGEETASTDSLTQQVKVPLTGHPTLHFATRINGEQATDTLKLTVNGKTLRTLTGAQTSPRYAAQSIDLTPYRGRTITLAWTSSTETPTTFLLDDIAIS